MGLLWRILGLANGKKGPNSSSFPEFMGNSAAPPTGRGNLSLYHLKLGYSICFSQWVLVNMT